MLYLASLILNDWSGEDPNEWIVSTAIGNRFIRLIWLYHHRNQIEHVTEIPMWPLTTRPYSNQYLFEHIWTLPTWFKIFLQLLISLIISTDLSIHRKSYSVNYTQILGDWTIMILRIRISYRLIGQLIFILTCQN